jgi:hypothetical protein
MKYEQPATGISKTIDLNKAICYRIDCVCTSKEHSVDTWIEVEQPWDDIDQISVMFYVNTYNKYNQNIWQRIKQAAKILFTGVDEKEHEILLKPQAALNWIKAVEDTISKMKGQNDGPTD